VPFQRVLLNVWVVYFDTVASSSGVSSFSELWYRIFQKCRSRY
jgi:hypothetical protein